MPAGLAPSQPEVTREVWAPRRTRLYCSLCMKIEARSPCRGSCRLKTSRLPTNLTLIAALSFCTCPVGKWPLTARVDLTGVFRAGAARENPCDTKRQQTSPLPLGKTPGQTGLTLGRIKVSASCLLVRQCHYGGRRTDPYEHAIQVPQRGEAGEVTLP